MQNTYTFNFGFQISFVAQTEKEAKAKFKDWIQQPSNLELVANRGAGIEMTELEMFFPDDQD